MGDVITKEVKELAEKAESLLPKITFQTSPADKLPEIDLTNTKEIATSLTNILQKIKESNQANIASLEKKITENTGNAISALQKRTVQSANNNLAVLSKKITDVAGESAGRSAALEKKMNQTITSGLTNLGKKIGETMNGKIGELQKKVGEDTSRSLASLEKKMKLDTGFDVSLLENKIGQLNAGLTSLQKRVAGSNASVNNALSAMQGLQKKVSANYGLVQNSLQTLKEKQGNLIDYGKDIQRIERRMGVLQGRLTRYRTIIRILAGSLVAVLIYLGYKWCTQNDHRRAAVQRRIQRIIAWFSNLFQRLFGLFRQ